MKIIRTELGGNTGDEYYQSSDGRWWEKWDGIDRTGEVLKTKREDIIE